MFGDEVDRPAFDLYQNLADIFANHADHDELDAAEHHDADEQRRVAGNLGAIDQGLVDDLQSVHEGNDREHYAHDSGKPQRGHGESGDPVDRQSDEPAHVPGAEAVDA